MTVLKVFAQRSRAIVRFDSKTGIGNLSLRAKTKTYVFVPKTKEKKDCTESRDSRARNRR